MYPRVSYEMTEADLAELLEACKPVIAMMIGGMTPPSQQANANAAWRRLGEKMGFDSDTVRPIQGKSNRYFSAVPSETPEARKNREEREAKARRENEIATLEAEINTKRVKLERLKLGEE